MKIENRHQQISNNKALRKKQASTTIATGTGIRIHDKNEVNNTIGKNQPNDPVVSKKILDSLSLGLINFSQKERDIIAKIMMNKSSMLE